MPKSFALSCYNSERDVSAQDKKLISLIENLYDDADFILKVELIDITLDKNVSSYKVHKSWKGDVGPTVYIYNKDFEYPSKVGGNFVGNSSRGVYFLKKLEMNGPFQPIMRYYYGYDCLIEFTSFGNIEIAMESLDIERGKIYKVSNQKSYSEFIYLWYLTIVIICLLVGYLVLNTMTTFKNK